MSTIREVPVPEIGDSENITVIEILVAPGDTVAVEDSLLTLESDKATMEVPSPYAGVIKELKVEEGSHVTQDQTLLLLEEVTTPEQITEPVAQSEATSSQPTPEVKTKSQPNEDAKPSAAMAALKTTLQPAEKKPHASPSVRHFARELGVELAQVSSSGPAERILKEDVQKYVKDGMGNRAAPSSPRPEIQQIDFSKFGKTESQPLTRIERIAKDHLQKCWSTVPQVTQFDEADITELEAFRKEHADDEALQGFKLTLLAFILKASAVLLKQFHRFNASLDTSGEHVILKKYYHIGFAVDTPAGLVVPVIYDVDQKGLLDLAVEMGELSQRARIQQLKPTEMQGASFTISSLGGIGGRAFTPIVNAPEAAILGVSQASIKPVYQYGDFTPRLILPFSLSYDHRLINGAEAARFTHQLAEELSDIRKLIL